MSETVAEVVTHHLTIREAREWILEQEGSLVVRGGAVFQLYDQSSSPVFLGWITDAFQKVHF